MQPTEEEKNQYEIELLEHELEMMEAEDEDEAICEGDVDFCIPFESRQLGRGSYSIHLSRPNGH